MYTPKTFRLYDQHGNRKYLNRAERRRFYQVAKGAELPKRLFYLMLFWTGGRISEILSLKANSIDFSDEVVIIESLKKRKRGVYRQIPLPTSLLMELKELIQNHTPEDRIWNWSRRTASRHIEKVMKTAKIAGIQSCPKGIRHSFAVHCVISNVPLTLIQKWMGHASLSTTAIYLNVVGAEERKFAAYIWEGM